MESAYLISKTTNITKTSSTKNIILGKIYKIFTQDKCFIRTTAINVESIKTKLLENFVFNLIKRGQLLQQFEQIYFSIDSSKKIDTDLAIKPDGSNQIIPINIAYSVTESNTFNREINELIRAIKYFNSPYGYLFTWQRSYKKREIPQVIRHLNIKDILMQHIL